jgi:hypothetical protein
MFSVKRLTSFALNLDGMPASLAEGILKELSPFNMLVTAKTADLSKFRYADDSMFISRHEMELRSTLIKKWTV